MPIDIQHLDWRALEHNPNRIDDQLTRLKHQLKNDPKHFDQNYGNVLKLRTMQSIKLVQKLDDDWFQLIQKMTTDYRKYYFGGSYPNYQGEIIDHMAYRLHVIRQMMLEPLDLVDNSYPTTYISDFEFSFDLIEDLNAFNYHWNQFRYWTNQQLLAQQSSFVIEHFTQKLVTCHNWQLNIQKAIVEQYHALSHEVQTVFDPDFENYLNHAVEPNTGLPD